MIDDIRLALNQNQPLGNERFYARIEKLTGVQARGEAARTAAPGAEAANGSPAGQGELDR
ncbi:MAG: hypothetical protein MZW92_76145 [Comamonadaceae bacterium]|nr:hypothetical protein [Comamonadaceae bacterium]